MPRTICVDFDGTIVEHAYPGIGQPIQDAIPVLIELKNNGWKLILFTCREGKKLEEAIAYCKKNGLEFEAHNESIEEEEFRDPGLNRKPYAAIYIDDRMIGGLPDWKDIKNALLHDYDFSWSCTPKSDQRQKSDFHKNYKLGETWKAHARRKNQNWFEKYAPEGRPGIDIGCQYDPLNSTFRRWDVIFGDGDAALMEGVDDNSFFTVYASHLLEHIANPKLALQNWWRILQPGGHLIIVVPHRDKYEGKKDLPSRWNYEHRWFYMPDLSESPCTISLKDLIERSLPEGNLISLKVLDEGYQDNGVYPPSGEYSIEAIIRKD